MANLSDILAARAATMMNPNVATDNGLNSIAHPAPPAVSEPSADDGWAAMSASLADVNAQAMTARANAQAQLVAGAAAATAQKDQARLAQMAATAAAPRVAANDAAIAAGKKAGETAAQQMQQLAAQQGAAGYAAGVKARQLKAKAAAAAAKKLTESAGAASAANPTGARGQALTLARSYLGTNYVLGGESHKGIDCSGLVQLVYTNMGFRVPTHSAADQGQTGGRHNGNGIPGVKMAWGDSRLQPGDIIAWKSGEHIAIYAGNGTIIEAASGPVAGHRTVERKLWDSPSNVVGIHLTFPQD